MTVRNRQYLSACLFLLLSGTAWAQRPNHYVPNVTPISPYMYYSAVNTTGVPNYYSYIRPTQQLRSYFQQGPADMARGATQLQLDQNRVTNAIERGLRVRETTGMGAPATPSTFMDHLHFYNRPVPRR